MTYTALYRKWRPRTFQDVIGQNHITLTLKNQIKNKSIAHAYLFCGTRGTGKTSVAKIFARAINCQNPKDDAEPCNECLICTGALNESLMDIIEIDAASNNGVDDIRELRENIKYPPTKAKYKVYIIDEVHMLSTGAFNALLKTLEEPPAYGVFILATTEPQKIPQTILSRCQRYDFKRVSFREIFERLKYICTNSGIKAEDKALELVARNSDGSVRDALSILDQCVAFSQGDLTYEKAIETLGFTTDEFLFKLTDAIGKGNVQESIRLIDELINNGKDIHQFLKDLINHFRNLMISKITPNLEGLINMSQESIDRIRAQGEGFKLNTIIRYIDILSGYDREIRWSNQPRALLELAVIKLLQPELDDSHEGLIDRIEKLENKIRDLEANGFSARKEEGYKPEKRQKEIPIADDKEDKAKVEHIDTKPSTIELSQGEEDLNTLDLDKIKEKWNEILAEIKRRKISVYALIIEGHVAALEGNKLIILFKDAYWFHKENAGKKPNSDLIEECIYTITKQRVKIKCLMEDEYYSSDEEVKEEKSREESEKEKEIQMVKDFFSDYADKLEIIE